VTSIERQITTSITSDSPYIGKRIDYVLTQLWPTYSRAMWAQALLDNQVKIDDKIAKKSDKITANCRIIAIEPTIEHQYVLFAPKTLPEVLFEDKDVIVIIKPAGLITHPTPQNSSPSVAGAFASRINDPDPQRPGIVHRLDKDTSGVMILARNQKSKKFLQQQFKDREVHKVYTSLVSGHIQPNHARLELPLGRSIRNPQKMIVTQSGKAASTEYKVVKEYTECDLLEIILYTGRTHQIRVQLAYLGHPVVGDEVYSQVANTSIPKPPRQFLHASSLTITLPSGDKQTFRAPLTQDLQNYLNQLV